MENGRGDLPLITFIQNKPSKSRRLSRSEVSAQGLLSRGLSLCILTFMLLPRCQVSTGSSRGLLSADGGGWLPDKGSQYNLYSIKHSPEAIPVELQIRNAVSHYITDSTSIRFVVIWRSVCIRYFTAVFACVICICNTILIG